MEYETDVMQGVHSKREWLFNNSHVLTSQKTWNIKDYNVSK